MSTEAEDLSSILSGSSAFAPSAPEPARVEPAKDVKPEPEKAPEPAAPSAAKAEAKPEPAKVEEPKQPRDESGRFVPKAEKPEKPEPMVPLSALLAERAKRREPEAPAKPKVSVLENEDQAFDERIAEKTAPLKQAVFEISIGFARSQHADFDEVAEVFSKAAERDERLWAQMRESSNPAMYIYQVGKQFKELAPFGGDLVKYREHVTAESRTETAKLKEQLDRLTAELESVKKARTELENVPRSLNREPSGSAKAGDQDPDDIKSIVRFGKTT